MVEVGYKIVLCYDLIKNIYMCIFMLNIYREKSLVGNLLKYI